MKKQKAFLITLIFLSFYSCKKKNLSIIELTDNAYKVVQNNDNCASIFLKNYGIEKEEERGYLFIKNYINQLKESNEDYSRAIMIQIMKSGEVITYSKILVQILPDNSAIINNYSKGRGSNSIVRIKNFNVNEFYSSMEELQKQDSGSRVKILAIDFTDPHTCDCHFYNKLKFNELKRIEDLSFFKL